MFSKCSSVGMPRSMRKTTVCPAIALFDRVQEVLKCLAVGRVARQHLVGQWKTFHRHHPRNHYLHTIGAMIPTITKATLVLFRAGRTALEIRACQVIEQYLEFHPEQVLPTLPQMPKERVLMRKHFVQAAIQGILSHDREVLPQQITHRTVLEPVPMQAPLTARIKQTIGRQYHQHVIPRRALTTG